MNIEEVTENLKKYISYSEKECNFPSVWDWNWHKDLANDVETLLTAYEKEKEKNKRLEKFIENGEYTWKQKYNETFEYFKEELKKKRRK